MTRNTKQKNIVLEALNRLNHPTAQEIYEYARKIYPQISLGTIYRVLGNFALNEKVLHIKIPNKPDHYDYQTHGHYHFSCKNCLCVYDIDIPYMENLNMPHKEYFIEDHNILFNGLCATCLKKEGK
ncbi:MAG: transcriptional repressor [Alphaproteobacteria bacterium]|nr:transcriptional repressor [Alphaproteobacteria bacterium]